MNIRFEHPELLNALWLLPLLWLFTVRSRALLTVRSRIVCSLIRSVVLALAAVALAQPFQMTWQQRKVPVALAFLVDRSQSVADVADDADARCQSYAALRSSAEKVFDLDFARTAWPKGSAGPTDRDGTNIEAALERARAEMGAVGQGAVLLVTDGRATGGEALQAAARLQANGIQVYVVPIGRHKQAGPRITSVTPPAQARVKEPVRIRVRVRSDYPAKIDIRFLDPQGTEVDRQVIDCTGECTTILRHIPQDPGLQRCTVLLANSSDIPGEQTAVSVPYYVEGPPKVLLVDTTPEETASLAAALGTLGVIVERRPAAGLSLPAEELATYEGVVLSDCASADVDAATQANLIQYVEQSGGGLVFVGGRNVSTKRWQGSALEKMLPIEFLPEEVKVIEQQNPAHVCFVLDKSGSMDRPLGLSSTGMVSKIQRVKEAVQVSAKSLPPTSLISVVVFDAATRVLVSSLPVSQWGNVSDRIDRLVADGGTVMDTALEAAIRLVEASNIPGYIILLTDGITEVSRFRSPAARWGDLLREIRDNNISLTTVAVSEEADRDLLEYLATSAGGVSYYCDNADEIPKIFIKEVETIRQVTRLSMTPFVPKAGSAADLIRNIPIGDYPALAGALPAKEKPLSQVVLTTDGTKPLLAAWQYGLGKVVAFTSDAKGCWARKWVAWEAFGRFWSQVAGWVLRKPEKTQVKLESTVTGRDVRVIVRVTDMDGHPVPSLRAFGLATPVAASSHGRTELAWQEIETGVYEGRCQLSQPGNHLCQIRFASDQKTMIDRALLLRPDDTAELAESGPDAAALEAVAATGGGLVSPTVEQVRAVLQQSVVQRIPVPCAYWPWLVLVAVLLWPVDVAARRILA